MSDSALGEQTPPGTLISCQLALQNFCQFVSFLHSASFHFQTVWLKLLLCHHYSTSLLTGVSNVTTLSYLIVTRHIHHSQREHRLCCSDDLPLPLHTTVCYRTFSFNSCERQCTGRTNTTRHTHQLSAFSWHLKTSVNLSASYILLHFISKLCNLSCYCVTVTQPAYLLAWVTWHP